jgi:16S rRNA (guanine(966)-N(2))-methyltransferase RsmD
MRVVAGTLRGRRLSPPGWPGLRPTSDRLRETLFNVLGPVCEGARFLDLCAGTGAVGIEALSRGAAHVTFVDADRRACALVGENLRGCGVIEGYTIVQSALDALPARLDGAFDVTFMDPPYDERRVEAWVAHAARTLVPGGLLVVEHASRRRLGPAAGLVAVRTLRAGDSSLAFYRSAPGAPPAGGGQVGETA